MNSGGCLNCDNEVRSAIREREAVIKLAYEKAKKENIEYVIYKDGGQWCSARVDRAITEGIPFTEVISQHLHR